MPWPVGRRHTESEKASIAAALRAHVQSSRGCKCAACLPRKATPELRARRSANARAHALARPRGCSCCVCARIAGLPVSAETKAKLSAIKRAHIVSSHDCGCVACGQPTSPTKIEGFLIEQILGEFPEVVPEKRFGPYHVDAYLPSPYHLAFEADGAYWHEFVEKRVPGHYKRRDAYLLEHHNLIVIRLTESELTALMGVS